MKSPLRSRERILLYGREGSGKTTAALQIAAIASGTAWVVSTDNSIERLLDTDFAGVFTVGEYTLNGELLEENEGDLNLYEVSTWPQYQTALLDIWERCDRDDVVIIDNITWPWDVIKTWYVEQTRGTDMSTWADQYRASLKDEKGHQAQESIFEDWSFINNHWYGLHSKKLVRPPCHLIVTANAKEMRTDGRMDKALKDVYGSLKMAPDTQKRVGGQLHTVLYMFSDRSGWYYATAKDRGRDQHTKTEWEDFPQDYLIATAGWEEPTKKKGLKAHAPE